MATRNIGGGHTPDDAFQNVPVTTTVTFDGATTDDPGDFDGTGNPTTLFTVPGTVSIRVLAVCTTLLEGATATLEVGVAGNTASLIAQTTATDIDAGEFWHDASPDSGVEAATAMIERVVAGGADIIQTVGTANITAGVIQYTAVWYPLSDGATVA